MQKNIVISIILFGFLFLQNLPCFSQEQDTSTNVINELKQEIQALRQQVDTERDVYEKRLTDMQEAIDAVSSQVTKKTEPGSEAELESAIAQTQTAFYPVQEEERLSGAGKTMQSLNPEISAIIDTFYHNSDAPNTVSDVLEEMAGFGHSHGHDNGHDHAELEEGFNIRHLELFFSGEVDPYFKAYAIAAISEHGAEMEEAVIQTTCLPAGFQFQAGKFFSYFGRINRQHSHEWDFVDQPLIYTLTLGNHGLNETGAQLSWLAPAPFHLLAGVEAFQGENELFCNYIGGEYLPKEDGPRLWVGWVKLSPNLPPKHGLQAGLFGGQGIHQEAHDGNDDETDDHWLNGYGDFMGADLVYKYDAHYAYGVKDFTLQAEFFTRKKDLSVYRHDLNPDLVGKDRTDTQDGYYVQALYGFLPRWRTGLRWEQVGLTNKSEFPDGTTANYDDSYRVAGMLDFSPTEFSRMRFQVNQGDYLLDDGRLEVWQIYMQLMVSLGTHGAHKF